MTSAHHQVERSIECSELYEEAITLFSYHDHELEKTFRLTKPVFDSKIIISLNVEGKEEYSVKTVISFPNEHVNAEILTAREIMEQKFRSIENIVDLKTRLNDLSKSESDREYL